MKPLLFSVLLVFGCSALFSQAKKPTIMVVPSDAWCNSQGYMMEFDNQGINTKVPNYQMAFQENTDLLLVISKINEMMTDRGFPLKNLESSLKNLQNQSAEDAMLMSKDGSELNESPIDILKKTAKADIWMQVTWSINTVGPKRSISFILQGIDAYTDKQIAGASGTGDPSFTAELPVLLEESVLSHIDNFNNQLQNYFDDLFNNGREITLRIMTWDSWEYDLESEDFGNGNEELNEIIEKWVYDNTVQHRFNTSDATENMMVFEQVRIPLYNDKGRSIDARGWANGLRKELKSLYNIESKLMTKGLGQSQLVLGQK